MTLPGGGLFRPSEACSGARRQRTVLRDLQMRPADWFALGLTVVGALILGYLALVHGFGRSIY